MIQVLRYTTINCIKVWKLYTLPKWVAPLAVVTAVGCGGYVAGKLLAEPATTIPIAEPAPYIIPFSELMRYGMPPAFVYPTPTDAFPSLEIPTSSSGFSPSDGLVRIPGEGEQNLQPNTTGSPKGTLQPTKAQIPTPSAVLPHPPHNNGGSLLSPAPTALVADEPLPVPMPEPGTWMLLGLAVVILPLIRSIRFLK